MGIMYRLLAELVVIIHFLFVAFVLLGGFLVLRYPRLAFLHLPAAAWGALIEFIGWFCPLTPLENHFRHLAGEQGYQTGFLEHYLIPLIYPETLTRELQLLAGAFVLGLNLAVYTVVLIRCRRVKQKPKSDEEKHSLP